MAKRKSNQVAEAEVKEEEIIVASENTEAPAQVQEKVSEKITENTVTDENVEAENEPEKNDEEELAKTEIKVETPESKEELVMEAKIIPETLKKAPEYIPSTYVVLTNTSQNRLSLVSGNITIDIEPREIKRNVRREDLKELLKNKVIQNWFDKGILSSNLDAEEKSAHEAVAPTNLTNAVERHENGMNIAASVKKFEPAGTVDISLL